MAKTPHLDHMRRFGFPVDTLLQEAQREQLSVLIITGEDADAIGTAALREIADSENVAVLVRGPTTYHRDERVTLPRTLAV